MKTPNSDFKIAMPFLLDLLINKRAYVTETSLITERSVGSFY